MDIFSLKSLHILEKLLSDDLLIMSHQIIFNEQLNVRCFLNEAPIRTRISQITDMRQISQLIQELDTYQRSDEIKLGITEAIECVKYTVEKFTTNEDTTGHYSQTLLNRYNLFYVSLKIWTSRKPDVAIMY